MPTTLSRETRKTLETVVTRARVAAEDGAEKAVRALAVSAREAPGHFTPAERELRVRLRAHGRQLGDGLRPDGTQDTGHLVTEVAYEHWHRMLFARFLEANDLLIHPDGYPVALTDCEHDAPGLGCRSGWEVAGRYAARMLPSIFRPDSSTLALDLPLESRQALERLLQSLPAEVFAAEDSLGWTYQFWQGLKKEEVQRALKQAGGKVGAEELPAITQLFTEPYMVAFLLENSLGGWWLGRHPGKPLPVEMPYLRRLEDGVPAAGTFPGWPDSLTDFRLLDPACGSGHFLVAALRYLVPMRVLAEGLSHRAAVHRVLAENLHGLELDPRCVEIAAFALALAAWRYPDERGRPLGHRPLPPLHVACCGIAPRSPKADWLKLAGDDARLEAGLAALNALFQKAPTLGSLIDPAAHLPSPAGRGRGAEGTGGDLFTAGWGELAPLLDRALAEPTDEASAGLAEARVAAQGMLATVRLLSQRYSLVITNPPYLGRGQQDEMLRDFCEDHYPAAKNDLANVFLERSLRLCRSGGTVQFVMPQNWLFQASYRDLRRKLLNGPTWDLLARLGAGAFETISGELVNVILLTLTRQPPPEGHLLRGIEASSTRSAMEKAHFLRAAEIVCADQAAQLSNPDSIVSLEPLRQRVLQLSEVATCYQGLRTGDANRFVANFWEIPTAGGGWDYFQTTENEAGMFIGLTHLIRWDSGHGALHQYARETRDRLHDMHESGNLSWGRAGVAISQMHNLRASVYLGTKYDNTLAVVCPRTRELVPAALAYITSPEYEREVRLLNRGLYVTNATLIKVPFDLAYWQRAATERYPNGLPKPYSPDPTQWIFHGHPADSTAPLQVAVARLLGYRWPAQVALTPGPSPASGRGEQAMELSDEAQAWVTKANALGTITHEPANSSVRATSLIDDDGIVCLPPVRGEATAVDRLRPLLRAAFGPEWSAAKEAQLLKDAGCEGLTLEQWLRDRFFEQHVAIFHRRPFIWHVWDGHKGGFSALVNYHKLTKAKLQTLIHTYLGDWITQQRRAVEAGDRAAPVKLARAEALKEKLLAILEGEAPYDIFVRWKALAEQPFGWDPDLNDGVRLNIRPFVEADVLRLPRSKLGIKWQHDRGKDVPSAPWYDLGPKYGEAPGTRINDHHTSLAEKRAAQTQKRTAP